MSYDALMKAKDFSASPAEVELKSFLQAALMADWRQAFIARGFGWHVDVGSFSTAITGGGNGTILDADQPELAIDVPNGTTLIPLRFHFEVGPGVQTTDDHEVEALLAVDRTAVSGGTATNGTVETPVNMRTDKIGGCPCSAVSAVTTNLTAGFTLGLELMHVRQSENFGDATGTELAQLTLLYEPLYPVFIVGPATVLGYWGGDIAATGFGHAQFLAISTELIRGLA